MARINDLDATIKTLKETKNNHSKEVQWQQPQIPFWHPMMNMPQMLQYPFKDKPDFQHGHNNTNNHKGNNKYINKSRK